MTTALRTTNFTQRQEIARELQREQNELERIKRLQLKRQNQKKRTAPEGAFLDELNAPPKTEFAPLRSEEDAKPNLFEENVEELEETSQFSKEQTSQPTISKNQAIARELSQNNSFQKQTKRFNPQKPLVQLDQKISQEEQKVAELTKQLAITKKKEKHKKELREALKLAASSLAIFPIFYYGVKIIFIAAFFHRDGKEARKLKKQITKTKKTIEDLKKYKNQTILLSKNRR